MTKVRSSRGFVAPLPLLALFGAFLVAMGYLIVASLTRRSAPVFPVSAYTRTRPANWQHVGDTLTIDATNGDGWQYVSLAEGRVLTPPDTAGWEIAAQRYRVISAPTGAIADVGAVPFDSIRASNIHAPFEATTAGSPPSNAAIGHWYRYNLLTHLLEPNGHDYVVRTRDGAMYKLAVLSYYCPHLVAGCVTVRYAPVAAPR